MLSESEAAEADAQIYADKFGVSLEVAKQRLADQVKIGQAMAALREGESATFAGAWVEHTPKWRVVVRTTAAGPSATAVEGYFSASTIPVTVKQDAPWSEQQTISNLQAMEQALDDVVDEYLLLLNPREPKGIMVSLRIPPDMSAATPEQLAQRLPALVTDKSASIGWEDGPLVQKEDVYGGAEIQQRNSSWLRCTTGYAVENASGTTGLVTAEHCSPNGAVDLDYRAPDGTEYAMTYQDGVDNDDGDLAWFTTGEVEDNRIYQSVTYLRTITSYEDGFGEMYAGQLMCFYGRASGGHCDTIHSLNESINMVAMEGEECDPGDSGGPWFHANRAYGVHEGEATVGGARRDVWSAVAFLEDAIDVTVLTE